MHILGNIKGFQAIRSLAIAALVSAPSWGAIPAHPGMLNYVEGQASINGQQVTSKQVGTAEVEQGEVLDTGAGKAEILLTPGVFLRLGNNSSVRLDSAGITNTQVEVLHGKAMVEATDLKKQNNIRVSDRGTLTTLKKDGLYGFDADQGTVSVYDGKAQVREDDRTVDLKKGKMTSTDILKTQKFNRKDDSDELYRWSDLRSNYLSEASAASARTYLGGGNGFAGSGWYWNPYYSFYSYLPGDGFLYSPFGYGFYSPFGYRRFLGGYYGGGYGGGYYGGGYYGGNRGIAHSGDRSGQFGRGASSGFRSTTSANTGFGRSAGSGFSSAGGGFSHASSGGGFGRAAGGGGRR